MFLPVGDTPNPRNYFPIVNWGLIVANVAVFVFVSLPLSGQPPDLQDPALREYLRVLHGMAPRASIYQLLDSVSAYDLFIFKHGYKPGAPAASDLFASMFLHGGVFHLAGNMLFLWIFGDNVEHRLGRVGYLLTYLGTGAVATLSFALFEGDSMRPLVGASGAISGVLGVYFLLFPRNKVKVFVFLFPILFDIVLLPVRWVLGFYVVIENLLPFILAGHSGVAYGAHLGGFVGGLLVAGAGELLAWRLPFQSPRPKLPEPEVIEPGSATVGSGVGVGALRAAIRRGDRAAALESLRTLDFRSLAGLMPTECTRLAEWLEEAGHRVAAATVLRRCLVTNRGRASDEELAEAYLSLGLLRLREGQQTAAYQHLLTAIDLAPDSEFADRARAALERIDVYRRRR